MINIKMQPVDVQKLSPKITVIGVGGAGGNAVNNMISSNLQGCEFLVCNTDAQALENSLSEHKIQLGVNVTGGLGAGSKPEIGKAAADESLDEVMQYLEGANMAFVTCGMGGGTGTGAAPVIAKACRERGILTVGVVTKPFHFEGSHRMKMAESGLEEMQNYVDTLIVIPNQNLFRIANEKTTFAEAFRMADSVLQSGVRGVTDLMVRPGLVNLDFADIRTAMQEMGKAMMGTGEASGERRAIEAAESAINNPLLDDVSMKGAHGVIINVTGGFDMTLFEADEAANRIRDEVDPDANIIFGATFDESLEGVMRVSIVATGIEKEAAKNSRPGSGKVGGNGQIGTAHLLERAKPQTYQEQSSGYIPQNPQAQMQPRQQQQTQPYTQHQIPPQAHQPIYQPAETRSMAQQLGVNTSSPVSATQEVRSMSAPQPLPMQNRTIEVEQEGDLFEQQQFTDAQSMDAQNTALRGSRYKDSFIPPAPATPGQPEAGGQRTVSTQKSFHQREVQSQQAPQPQHQPSSQNLNLRPPKAPEPKNQKRSPSLFERITGSVQDAISGIREDDSGQSMQQSAPQAGGVAPSPAQGRLNIDAPAAKPKAQAEDELDIPAFLRRQAN